MEKSEFLPELSVKISGFAEEAVNGKSVTFYLIDCVMKSGKKWTLKRRFSDFEKLNEELKKTHRSLPPIPGKTMFAPKNKDDIERRRRGLEEYLQAISLREDVYCKTQFAEFLDLHKENSSLVVNQMEALAEISDSQMGYRDALFFLEQDFAVAVLHYVKITSRMDSYLSGLFKKKKTAEESKEVADKETVGAFQFLIRGKGTELTDFSIVWRKKFTSQAICVNASLELNRIAIGLDNGDIVLYEFNSKELTLKDAVDTLNLPKAHASRVMRVVFDNKRERLYSIGEDKKLRVTGIKNRDNDQSLKCFDKGLTDMCFDEKSSVAVISDSGSNIYTVDLSKSLPSLGHKVKLAGNGPIRGIDVDWSSGHIFSCSYGDGLISILRSDDINDAVLSWLSRILSLRYKRLYKGSTTAELLNTGKREARYMSGMPKATSLFIV